MEDGFPIAVMFEFWAQSPISRGHSQTPRAPQRQLYPVPVHTGDCRAGLEGSPREKISSVSIRWKKIRDSAQGDPGDVQERTVRGVPEDAEECGNIPAPQEQAHLQSRVRAAPPENRRVKNKPGKPVNYANTVGGTYGL